MNVELSLLRLLLTNTLYKRYRSLVDDKSLKETFRELSYLYQCLDGLRQTVDHDVSVDELEAYFWAAYPDAKKDLYAGLFTDLRSLQISEDVGEVLLGQIESRKQALKLSEKAFQFSQGLVSLSDVQAAAADLGEAKAADINIDAVSTDLEQLINNVVKTPGLRWRLDSLNKSLGSLRKGDFGFIFARPESGKTTFLASEVSKMLDDATSPILWLNNEEQGEKVMIRIYQAYFGVTLEQLLGNTKQFKKLFNEQVEGRFILVDDAGIDRGRIERIVDKVRPSLIVHDQIDKTKGFKADRDDLVLGAIYQWGRELAKGYCPYLAVCQSDGSGEGQKWLSMANVANAKTSKQAEADFILGIGKTHDEATENIRYLNISKNKLLGDEDSIAAMRHGRFEVLIQPEVARYKDVINYA
jgi:hypothetical protein